MKLTHYVYLQSFQCAGETSVVQDLRGGCDGAGLVCVCLFGKRQAFEAPPQLCRCDNGDQFRGILNMHWLRKLPLTHPLYFTTAPWGSDKNQQMPVHVNLLKRANANPQNCSDVSLISLRTRTHV